MAGTLHSVRTKVRAVSIKHLPVRGLHTAPDICGEHSKLRATVPRSAMAHDFAMNFDCENFLWTWRGGGKESERAERDKRFVKGFGIC